jgi:hypothetical protein
MEQKPQLSAMIKGLNPGLPEVGKIKIGMKGQMTTSRAGKKFQLPKRLDHFIVTGLERGPDGNFLKDEAVHQVLGERPVEIPVGLLYNDPELNFQSRWACFTGTTLWCTGDGENAYRKQQDGSEIVRSCPCERAAPDFDADQYRCKTSGVLSVMLDDMQMVGGVYKFRTTSYNSVINIMSSLALISRVTGGVLAGIQLMLTVRPKTVIVPKTNKAMVVHIVGIEYRGSLKALADVGYRAALSTETHRQQIEQIETVARQSITQNLTLTEGETETDIAEEFYPESVAADAGTEVKAEHEEEVDIDTKFEDIFGTSPAISGFLVTCAEQLKQPIEEIMISACENQEYFNQTFDQWQKNQPEPQQNGKYADKMPADERDVGKTQGGQDGLMQSETVPQTRAKTADNWNPETEPLQKRYAGGKKERVIAALEARGVEYNPGWPGPQLHSRLLSIVAQAKVAGQQEKSTFASEPETVPPIETVPQQDEVQNDDPVQPNNFDGGPAGYAEAGEQPENEGNGMRPAESVPENAPQDEPAVKYYHDIDELSQMPALLQHIYGELAETQQCMSEELSPKSVNSILKLRYPIQWEKARQALGFSFIAQTDEAADRWNLDTIALLEGSMGVGAGLNL